MATLNDILTQVNSYFALSGSVPVGDDYTLLTYYANRALSEAAATAQLPEFQRQYITTTSTLATISLPSNFREFMGPPQVRLSSGTYDTYEEIKPHDKYAKNASDKYCYVLGNPADGFSAVFNNLTANATLSIDYQRYPSGFATLTSVCELSDEYFIVRKVESYILQSRVDDRASFVDADASRMMKNLIGRKMRTNGQVNTTPKTSSYRLGE